MKTRAAAAFAACLEDIKTAFDLMCEGKSICSVVVL
jgi:hypothetical protein